MSAGARVSVERADNGVATLTMHASGRMPVLSLESGRALGDALEPLAADPEVRVVVLRGENGQFCAGGDIAAIRDGLDDPPAKIGPIIDQLHRCVRALHAMPQPVIASVAGAAAGGGLSLAMACNLIVCADNARFVVGYPALGTSSDGGLSYTLTRRVGAMRAMDLILARSHWDAPTALSLGLAARIVDAAALDAETAAYAAALAQNAPQVLREFKALMLGAEDDALSAQLDAERAAFLRCAQTADFRRRVEAFLQKRR